MGYMWKMLTEMITKQSSIFITADALTCKHFGEIFIFYLLLN